mgnify:CR=1 FL=1
MYNKYSSMKKSQLKEAIKVEIKSVLTENKGEEDYHRLNDNEQDVAILNNMTKKYGKDVVLYWLTGGNYGSLDEQSNNPNFDKKVASFAKKINNEMDYPGGVLEAMKQIKNRLERIISKVEGAKRGGAEEEPLMKMIGLSEGKRGVVVDPDEIMGHINQYENGNIDGDDLAQAIEEILVAMMNKSVSFSDIREEDEMTDAEKKKAAEKDAKKEKDFANKQKEVDKLKKELADNKDELVKISKISRDERTKAQQNLLDDMAKKTKELKKLRRVEA